MSNIKVFAMPDDWWAHQPYQHDLLLSLILLIWIKNGLRKTINTMFAVYTFQKLKKLQNKKTQLFSHSCADKIYQAVHVTAPARLKILYSKVKKVKKYTPYGKL